ncbi:hypothetical protein [Nocardia sp. bgisy118]|uniref:hypothetical protein n=1 Tax=Nocardia sp. bgisy118 TaxID=3413786 RepID=UPI003F4A6BF6
MQRAGAAQRGQLRRTRDDQFAGPVQRETGIMASSKQARHLRGRRASTQLDELDELDELLELDDELLELDDEELDEPADDVADWK